ncbi:MAG: UDP-glucose 6-dehydrogenase, partial [Proteobacteria bacterium]|nr:UDP-glucose 6-dehydrogenase [Pseudomonadota bacterium]
LTFKPNTDDMRDAPSISVITALMDGGATIRAYDPEGMEQAKAVLPAGVTYCGDAYECVAGADAAVIVTEWNIFRALDLDRVKATMAAPVLVDLRNVYRAEQVRAKGFSYADVGRGLSPLEGKEAETAA